MCGYTFVQVGHIYAGDICPGKELAGVFHYAGLRFITSARVYNSCARICARIFMKFKTSAHKIVIDHQPNSCTSRLIEIADIAHGH